MREKQLTQKGFLVIDLRKSGTVDTLDFCLTERDAGDVIWKKKTLAKKGRWDDLRAVPATVTFELP